MSSQWKMTGGNLTDFIWQYISQTATLYNWILKIETETKFATLLLKKKGKTEHSLSIKNWTSLRMNIQIFLWVSNGGEPNSNSTTGKTKHFLFKNAPKKASKILQKCNFYFKMLLKCFEIDSKCNSIPKMLLKCSKNAALFPICFK